MIEMTTELFEKFATKQEELDSMIREKFNISEDEWNYDLDTNHDIALFTEMYEFINECRDAWKYWKQKAINHDRIIDEAVDVIHFLHLLMNKVKESHEYDVEKINKTIFSLTYKQSGVKQAFIFMNECDEYPESYGALLYILDHYNFTLEDIEQAYDRKNKINHDRQAQDY